MFIYLTLDYNRKQLLHRKTAQDLCKLPVEILFVRLFSFAPLEILASQRKRVAANEKVQLGVIGCNGMGWSDLRSHLQLSDVECIALCDVDQGVLDRRAADVEKAQGKRPQF